MRMIWVTALALSCTPDSAPPDGWLRRVDPSVVGPACISMIGGGFRPRVPTRPRDAHRRGSIDLADPAIPAAIADLDPIELIVRPSEVQIVLGRYPTGYADEHDSYGLVCTASGRLDRVSNRFRTMEPPGTFLRTLGHGVFYYRSIL